MYHSLRFNSPPKWRNHDNFNYQFFGLVDLCHNISNVFGHSKGLKMLEIGSYKGESTSIFASSAIFDEIICIDPFEGEEEALNIFNEDWSRVKKEFYTNTRYWDYIKLIQDYSYNVVKTFEDGYFDFIYIDGNHTYESVKQDIKLYLPKCKTVIGGHDYRTTGWEIEVVNAVNEQLGAPDLTFVDSSWVKYL